MKQHTVIDSPYGPLTLVATDGVLSGLYMTDQRHRPPEETFGDPDDAPFTRAIDELRAYFAGELQEFTIQLHLHGTLFQRSVWDQLRRIPYGETRSYGDLADALGNPKAFRAVGLANGKNPLGIIVPCHRVVGADGSLTGYGGGLARKRRLLDFERGAGRTRTAPCPLRPTRRSGASHQRLTERGSPNVGCPSSCWLMAMANDRPTRGRRSLSWNTVSRLPTTTSSFLPSFPAAHSFGRAHQRTQERWINTSRT